MDEALYRVQDAIYGEKKGNEDIPYIVEDPSGFRKINRFATRHNIALKLIKKPWLILLLFGIAIAIVVLVVLLT